MKTNKKGISLIVLIITILVMIIIAASVILYLDDSKVLRNAKKAVSANNVSVAKEVITVARAEWRTNRDKIVAEGEYTTFKAYAENKLEEAGFEIGKNAGQVEAKENGLLYAYMEPVIPEGFVASNVPTEDTITEGLVIYEGYETVTEDNVEEAMETRNQFVWVPVPNITEFVRKDWGYGITGTDFNKLTSYNLDSAEEAAEYNALKESVAKYGGFYIARYEAGIEGTDTLVSKKNATVWDRASFKVAKQSCATLRYQGVVSHLLYGEEWDAALKFIATEANAYPTNSAGKGHHVYENGSLIEGKEEKFVPTGYYEINNIYDMAGNAYEWTMERYSNYCVQRGSSYLSNDSSASAAYRESGDMWDEDYWVWLNGFRPALYLK